MSSKTLSMRDDVYKYLINHSVKETKEQKELRILTSKMDQGNIQISPEQGQFIQLLIKLRNAKRIIGIGVFKGCSTLCMALGLSKSGYILACDTNKDWTGVAEKFWEPSGCSYLIDLKIGPALDQLDLFEKKGEKGTYDFAFIDADKMNYESYYESCLSLLRFGGLIAIDNTLWSGDVANKSINNGDTNAIRNLNKKLFNDGRVYISMLSIGDGLTLALKK